MKSKGNSTKKVGDLLNETIKDDGLSEFKERFKDFITYHKKALDVVALNGKNPEKRFCENVIAKQEKKSNVKSSDRKVVSDPIKSYESKIDEKKYTQVREKYIEQNARRKKIQDVIDVTNSDNDVAEPHNLELKIEKENVELYNENMDLYIRMIGSDIQSMMKSIKKNKNATNDDINNIQEILVFVVKEKLLPSETIKELTRKFLDIKLLKNQYLKIDSSKTYTLGDVNENNLKNYDPELLNHLDDKKISDTIKYHYNRINDLVLKISSSTELTPNILNKTLSYIERDKNNSENKKALISALETRIFSDPKSFLFLQKRYDLLKRLYDNKISIEKIVAGNSHQEKDVVLKAIIMYSKFRLRASFDDIDQFVSILDGEFLEEYDKRFPEIKQIYSDIIKLGIIPTIEKKVFNEDNKDKFSSKKLFALVMACIITEDTYRLKKSFALFDFDKLGDSEVFINDHLSQIYKLAIKKKCEKIIDIVEDFAMNFIVAKFDLLEDKNYELSNDTIVSILKGSEYLPDFKEEHLKIVREEVIPFLTRQLSDIKGKKECNKKLFALVVSCIVTQDAEKLEGFFKKRNFKYEFFSCINKKNIDLLVDLKNSDSVDLEGLDSELHKKKIFVEQILTPLKDLAIETKREEVMKVVQNIINGFVSGEREGNGPIAESMRKLIVNINDCKDSDKPQSKIGNHTVSNVSKNSLENFKY